MLFGFAGKLVPAMGSGRSGIGMPCQSTLWNAFGPKTGAGKLNGQRRSKSLHQRAIRCIRHRDLTRLRLIKCQRRQLGVVGAGFDEFVMLSVREHAAEAHDVDLIGGDDG